MPDADIPTGTDPRNAETIHVFSVDLALPQARALAEDEAALSAALGGIAVDVSRAEAIDPRGLAEYGLSGYLTDGEGASADAVLPDEPRLDAATGPVLVLRPRAVRAAPDPEPPLTLLGRYPMEAARPAGAPIRAASAEGSAAGTPPSPEERTRSERRASGLVAMAALAVALLVAFIVWAIAA